MRVNEFFQFRCIIFILILYLSFTQTQASELNDKKNIKSNPSIWFGFGVGGNYFGPTFNINASLAINKNLFAMRYYTADELRFNPGGGGYDEPALRLREIGILYGRYLKEDGVRVSALVGISYIDGIIRGNQIINKEYEKIQLPSIGIPVELNMQFEIAKIIGLGFSAIGNVNSRKVYFGGLINITFGSLQE